MSEVLIQAENVGKKFCRDLKKSLWYGVKDSAADLFGRSKSQDVELRGSEFWANEGISFELKRGECLGLIGRNGAGKTTLLKMLTGLIKPDTGRIETRGRVGAMIALGAGFNPILTGRENIYVNGAVLGLSVKEINERFDEIVDFSELKEFIDAPVQTYSSGMKVRLGFAVATTLDPDVLVLDEVLAVGDAKFRSKCYRRVVQLKKRAAMIFVSHNVEQVGRICDRVLMLSSGRCEYLGEVADGIDHYERANEEGVDEDKGFLTLAPPIVGFSIVRFPERIRSGGRLEFEVEIESTAALDGCTVRCLFYNATGSFAADTIGRGQEHGISLRQGRQRWGLSIAHVPLKNGTYRCGLNFLTHAGDLAVWSYKEVAVSVVGAEPGAVSDCQLFLDNWSTTQP